MLPIRPAYAARLSQLGDDPLVTRMLTSIILPFTAERARSWITPEGCSPEEHRLAITTLEGHLVGACALSVGGNSGTIAGWIGRERWREGYGFEAARRLTADAFARFSVLEQLECNVMHDNAAAIRIMQKLGFEITGENLVASPARGEHTKAYLFCLTRPRFEGQL